MKQCKECGFPARFADLFQWRGDGTILMESQGAVLRLALLDADELQAPAKAAKTIEWDRERGAILDRPSGHRDVMFAVQSLNALQRELEAELGEQVRDIMCATQLDLSRRSPGDSLTDEQGTFWDAHTLGLALRGMGYPITFTSRMGRSP